MTDELRETLLGAAGRLIATEGIAALTVRRIAAEAGSSTMGVYSRFGGKEGVVDALLYEGFEALRDALTARPDTDDPFEDMVTGCAAYRDFARANPTRYQVMFATPMLGLEASPASIEMAAASFACVCAKAQRCLDAGVVAGYAAHEIASSVWAAAHGLVSLDLLGRRPPVLADDDPYERTIRTLLRGFAPTAPTPRPMSR
ncbi:MAG TPA: TetR/AcrR family transcriptional regulator [Acidimicrobiales bacterium]|nr:TetR/AcrR family transcriptional regulator [Acidimicrobiales bacterium]